MTTGGVDFDQCVEHQFNKAESRWSRPPARRRRSGRRIRRVAWPSSVREVTVQQGRVQLVTSGSKCSCEIFYIEIGIFGFVRGCGKAASVLIVVRHGSTEGLSRLNVVSNHLEGIVEQIVDELKRLSRSSLSRSSRWPCRT